MSALQMIFLLFCGHAIMDFALQTEWLARNKNRHARKALPPEMLRNAQVIWPHLMTAHALMHAAAVFYVTQSLKLAFFELVAHWVTDFAKCERWIDFHVDQFIHFGCKLLWAYLFFNVL